jgi:hypothetical protein
MATPQKGKCKLCGRTTGDKRRAWCKKCRIKGRHRTDTSYPAARMARDNWRGNARKRPYVPHDGPGYALVRRILTLRRRAEARLPLFERNERAKTD